MEQGGGSVKTGGYDGGRKGGRLGAGKKWREQRKGVGD